MRGDDDGIERLLGAWRDAVRAATLADRLAGEAADGLGRDGRYPDNPIDLAELAQLAEQAAASATRAGDRSRHAAAAYHQAEDEVRGIIVAEP